jgi:ring-1,2-phenylacetyl-CoA epoxidase subunit PaaE
MNHFFALTVADVRQETRDAVVVTFAVPPALADTFRYVQGQYLTLRTRIGGEEVRRAYSICSGVGDGCLRVAIKRAPGGLFSNWANDTLRPGDVLDVMPPLGSFNLPLDPAARRHYLAFAAGSGITPVLSILTTTLAAEPLSSFTLFYGNRASSSTMFKDELAALKDRYLTRLRLTHVLSREPQDIDLFHGRIDRARCDRLFERWVDLAGVDAVFLCGPAQMTADVAAALQARGFPREAVKTELFAPAEGARAHVPRTDAARAGRACEVTVIVDGTHRRFAMERDRESLLDAALRHGIDIGYSCKAGVCSTCRCKVVAGKVDMDANYALEDYEVARGCALSCQSFPATDSLTVDFDTVE